ncbi:MAG: hypothetical protein NTW86_15250 [Candidatus Sumerlaeota bacterium]|nr:hypothetical protein [Candidatus Sumerlaeota bacterium]
MKIPLAVTVLQDSREQQPLPITKYPVEVVGLPVGDYSLKGFGSWENPRITIERKTIADLVSSLTSGRERFFREIQGLCRFERAFLVIEGEVCQIEMGQYKSRAYPQSILGSLEAIEVRTSIKVLWCYDAERMARRVEGLFEKFLSGMCKQLRPLLPPGVSLAIADLTKPKAEHYTGVRVYDTLGHELVAPGVETISLEA